MADQDRSVPATSAAQAALFLRRLDPKAKMHCFQTFYERKDSNRSDLTRVIHSKDLSEVTALHDQGAAVFTCVNRTDGLGRKNENITHVRAVWCEADTIIQRHFPLPPSLEVQTSPGRYHYYWLVQGDDWPADEQGCADHSGIMER